MPDPGAGVCRICRGPAAGGRSVCFACGLVARRLGLPLAPVVPARLCPLPSPLYTVLLGYKESPVAEARLRFGAIVRALLHALLLGHGQLEATVGGPIDLVTLVPSTHRPGRAPLGLVAGIGGDVAARPPGGALGSGSAATRRSPGGPPPVAHMRPDPAAFTVPVPDRAGVAGARVLLLDDTYVSGSRSQSAAAALQLAGARAVIAPLGRVLRPDRVALHADFLDRHAA